jgi:hypothetical protein
MDNRNVEETKGIILSRIYPARDVVHLVWDNISALIRCNFIIANYVNRKITSYTQMSLFVVWDGGSTYNFMFYMNARRLNNCSF